MRVRAIVVALLALAGMAGAAGEKPRPGEAQFRQAWQTYVQPLLAPEKFPTRAAVEAVGAQAVEEMKAAVAAQRGNADYLVSLSYLQFQTFKWREAQETAQRASRAAPKAALPMVLLAGVKGAIAAAQTEDTTKAVEEGLAAYRRAAERDPNNAAILLQAASTAFDARRPWSAPDFSTAAAMVPDRTSASCIAPNTSCRKLSSVASDAASGSCSPIGSRA